MKIYLANDDFLRKYCAAYNTEHVGWCSIIWMTTQKPPFAMPFTRTQKPPVLVIETTHYQKRRSCVQLVTGPFKVPWVLEKVAFKTTVKAGWNTCVLFQKLDPWKQTLGVPGSYPDSVNSSKLFYPILCWSVKYLMWKKFSDSQTK